MTATLTRQPLAPQSARNATPQEMYQLLAQQRSQVVDLILPAEKVMVINGKLEINGAAPILRPDGVLDPNGSYRLTSHADGQLASQFDIPVRYLRRLRDENIDLFDFNVNSWANHPSYADKKILARLFWANDPEHPENVGVARSFMSNRYGARDNFDTLAATIAGIREAGLAADNMKFHGDITERTFYVVIEAPEIQGYAHNLFTDYRSPYAGRHGGSDAENLPIVSAGLIVANSEVGAKSLSVTPRIVFRMCGNGAQQTKDVVAFRHTGTRLDEGVVNWSDETRSAANELSKQQVKDAVKAFLNVDYVNAKITEMEAEAGVEVKDVPKVIEAVSQQFSYTEDEAKDLMNFFVRGGQLTSGGILNAVTAMVQQYDDADRAYEVEATAVPAMQFVAAMTE